MPDLEFEDCIVIGIGPGGMTAALNQISVAVGHAAVAAITIHNVLPRKLPLNEDLGTGYTPQILATPAPCRWSGISPAIFGAPFLGRRIGRMEKWASCQGARGSAANRITLRIDR